MRGAAALLALGVCSAVTATTLQLKSVGARSTAQFVIDGERRDARLGLFTDEAPHLVYLLQSFLAEAEVQTLYVGQPLSDEDHTPDLVSMVFRSSDGVPGSLQMTFVGAVSEWMLVVMGTRGTVVADFFRDVCFAIPDDKGHLTPDVLRTQVAAVGGHLGGTLRAGVARIRGHLDYGNDEVVRRFTAAVQTGVAPEGISGADGRNVVAVLEAAHRASGNAT